MTNFAVVNDMSIEEGSALYEARAQQALQTLTSKGFCAPSPPMVQTQAGPQPYQGHVPTNLPDLTDNELGFHMGLLSEWNNYVQWQLAEANVRLGTSKSILEHIEAKLRIAYQIDDKDKKRSNPERDDYMTTDRRFIEAKSNVIYWDTIYTTVRAIANAAEQSYAAVSRRITQRGQEIDRNNRTGAISGHANLPQGPMFGGARRG